ncbi:MAG TPA: helix-turn-helix domain-containing protein [Solirubrobacteraceae bacterium]|nr:helix-turn-helix domain-containing protein [Solirubrobacteraceae bacterium]
MPGLAEEIIAAVSQEVPVYAAPLQGPFGDGIRQGVVQALTRFLIGDEPGADSGRINRGLGRGEYRAGRSLDALQAAYRVGARVSWRRVSRIAAQAGVPVEAQHQLAEAIFAYIDELAAESVEGYAQAQAAQAASLQRHREELLRILTAEPPVPIETVQQAALRADWPLPPRVAMIACAPAATARIARRLSGQPLYTADQRHGGICVPDSARLQQELSLAARRDHLPIALGPAVPITEAGRSLRWAVLALQSARPGRLVESGNQLERLILDASPDITSALRLRVLEPLSQETPASRIRLEATLLAWLRHHGAQAAIAAELGVHPQTVRYRMGRLRELFGPALDDPDKRFQLQLALQAVRST